eukprot:5029814-Prymnesium_polylepis.1
MCIRDRSCRALSLPSSYELNVEYSDSENRSTGLNAPRVTGRRSLASGPALESAAAAAAAALSPDAVLPED